MHNSIHMPNSLCRCGVFGVSDINLDKRQIISRICTDNTRSFLEAELPTPSQLAIYREPLLRRRYNTLCQNTDEEESDNVECNRVSCTSGNDLLDSAISSLPCLVLYNDDSQQICTSRVQDAFILEPGYLQNPFTK